MTNAPRFSVVPMQGQTLPKDWQIKAKQRAADAEASYRQVIENAWRGKSDSELSIVRGGRLPEWRDLFGER